MKEVELCRGPTTSPEVVIFHSNNGYAILKLHVINKRAFLTISIKKAVSWNPRNPS